jgi:putative flavoprotein involved in K+ transport
VVEHIETIIVGGGQSGLSISYYLKEHEYDHVVFEKANRASNVWQNRWDSFTLVTPNWMIQLPGAQYRGNDPDGFMNREEVVAYFDSYVERNQLPVHCGVEVLSVEPSRSGFWVKTNQKNYHADNVVIAVGFYQHPKIPSFSNNCAPEIYQIHSDQYRNNDLIPEGAVLVVGSAQSGSQIAEELNEHGRKVYLAVSETGRFPRRYRGKDASVWMEKLGYFDRTVDQLPSSLARFAASAHGTGKNGGHTINMHQFARDGIILLGRIGEIQQNLVRIEPGLHDCLRKADQFELEFVKEIDNYIKDHGLDVPEETFPYLEDGFQIKEITELHLQDSGIHNIIWATGYSCDFSWVRCPVFGADGLPVHERGVTQCPGLYFIGMPFLHSGKSGLIYGSAEDAAYIAAKITSRESKKIIKQ